MKTRRIRAKKLNNARDLGGLTTQDGRRIKCNKLIRCGQLYKLPTKTVGVLKQMGVTTVCDIRTYAGVNDKPDTLIGGVRYEWLPVICTPEPIKSDERTMRLTLKRESYRLKREFHNIDNYMIQMYKSVLFTEDGQASLRKFIRLVIDEDGCILWHCASGKDRTGICAMLIEGLLGIEENAIIEDYMSSRKFCRRKYFWNRIGLIFAPIAISFKKILFGFMRVKRLYIETAINEIKSRYGNIANYCKTVFKITDEDIDTLKIKYLV